MKSELHFFRVTEFNKPEILILMDYQLKKSILQAMISSMKTIREW